MKTTIVINREGMGEAPAELSLLLIQNYLTLLLEDDALPAYICLYAGGVKLTVDGSPVLEQLRALEARGVNLLICKTCLNYYGLTERVAAGTVATMVDIMGAQKHCDKVIVL